MRTSLQMDEMARLWGDAAVGAANLSETELLVGDIDPAVAMAEKAVALADLIKDEFKMIYRTT